MATRVAVVVFPGSNCEFDTASALEDLGASSELVFHDATTLNGCDAVVIPGGFAHGDYLRPGAIARFSPVMAAVTEHAKAGGPVLGICNGFQVLTECGLLPGALQKNAGLKFRCETAQIRIETTSTSATRNGQVGQVLNIPINHFEGNYACSPETLAELRAEDRIVFSYVQNPNGSMADIAGVCNDGRNVVGLMPHPERASHSLLGSTDGRVILSSLLARAETMAPTP